MNKVIMIGGPTASGKSQMAIELAKKLKNITPVQIINTDSIQVYDHINILSSQPSENDRKICNHSLYGIFSPRRTCSAWIWRDLAEKSIKSAWSKNYLPILVGGTGLYFKSLIEGLSDIPDIDKNIRLQGRNILESQGSQKLFNELLQIDPDLVSSLNYKDSHRVLRAWEVFFSTGKSISYWQNNKNTRFLKACWYGFSILPNREKLYSKINSRFIKMIELGAVEEVRDFLNRNLNSKFPCSKAIGIQELSGYLKNLYSLDKAIELSQQSTRRLAKRQYTWFRNQMKGFRVLDGELDSNLNKIFNITYRLY
ncbi:MAG: tRNA dimethylallyltransferase [Alphaproteobacteria bacterium MarineAlpha2_Bin1]|nr:MAG: tRNA dimethylallyltransferase [Alphaproteobacteria bacterium MarineAlpha2_Bin1]|tara:strand:+ start:188 stop:1120 length:933 start_codon:yes stop_codon:yes gene_type:complete